MSNDPPIIDFRTRRLLPLATKPKEMHGHGFCSHDCFELDLEKRTVECTQCNKEVDAFFALTVLSHSLALDNWRLDERIKAEAKDAESARKRREKFSNPNFKVGK